MSTEWLTLNQAATKFGYSLEGFRDRLRQLRALGYVADIGSPPPKYAKSKPPNDTNTDHVVVLWANPKAAMIRVDAPAHLFDSRHGYRAEATPPANLHSRKKKQ